MQLNDPSSKAPLSEGWSGHSWRLPNMISAELVEFAHHREFDWIDLLARQLHVVIAAKLRRDPNLIGIPLHNLRLWKKTADAETKILLRRWKLILLTWPPEEILEFLVADTAESSALRKCSPFCGILTPTEIASVWQASSR